MTDQQKVREAIAELIAADIEYDKARSEWWDGERYDQDSYGVHGSEFYICRSCENESGAGILNKGVSHEPDCKVAALERAEERRKAALAHASIATAEECSVDALSDWLTREMPAGTVIGDPAWWAKRIAGRVHLLASTNHAPSAEDANGWREMDSAPIDKAIMGAWFGSPDYTEVSPVIYCSERDKWMNPDDMRDDEYTKPDMWHPYPVAPKHRDVDQALAAERGEK